MNIIKYGNPEKAELNKRNIIVCPRCEAEFEPDRNEWTSYPNGKKSISCPCCNHFIIQNEDGTLEAPFDKIIKETRSSTNVRQKLVDKIIDALDIERIHAVMTALDWKWCTVDGIPTIEDITRVARDLIIETLERKQSISTAGFTTKYFPADASGKEGVSIFFGVTDVAGFITFNDEIDIY